MLAAHTVAQVRAAEAALVATLPEGTLMQRAAHGLAHVVLDLLGVAVAGGMFVVPLYAFLTTTVPKSETSRTVAANNIVNSGAMVAATLILTGLVLVGVSVAEMLFLVAVGSIIAAWLGYKLHLACDQADCMGAD